MFTSFVCLILAFLLSGSQCISGQTTPSQNGTVASHCPPGFYGDRCQNVCHCYDQPERCDSRDGRCLDVPCGPGWTNHPYCQTECPLGSFGLNCSMICHCPSNDTCNRVNGLCSSHRCHNGWTGRSCATSLPVLFLAPNVSISSFANNTVTLTWPRFLPNITGSGDGPVWSYVVQSMEERPAASSNWSDVRTVLANETNQSIGSVMISERLMVNRSQGYKFRVNVILLNNKKPGEDYLPGPGTNEWIRIQCTEPTVTVSNLSAEIRDGGGGGGGATSKRVRISWEFVAFDPIRWGCDNITNQTIAVNCSQQCQPCRHAWDPGPVPFPLRESDVDLVRVFGNQTAIPRTLCVSVSVVNNAGLAGPNSQPIVFNTQTDAVTTSLHGATSANDVTTIARTSVTQHRSSVTTGISLTTGSSASVAMMTSTAMATESSATAVVDGDSQAPVIPTEEPLPTGEGSGGSPTDEGSGSPTDEGSGSPTDKYHPGFELSKEGKGEEDDCLGLVKRSEKSLRVRVNLKPPIGPNKDLRLFPKYKLTVDFVRSVYTESRLPTKSANFTTSFHLNVFDVKGLQPGTLYLLDLNATYYGSVGEVTAPEGNCVTLYWTWQLPPPPLVAPEIMRVSDETVELMTRIMNVSKGKEVPNKDHKPRMNLKSAGDSHLSDDGDHNQGPTNVSRRKRPSGSRQSVESVTLSRGVRERRVAATGLNRPANETLPNSDVPGTLYTEVIPTAVSSSEPQTHFTTTTTTMESIQQTRANAENVTIGRNGTDLNATHFEVFREQMKFRATTTSSSSSSSSSSTVANSTSSDVDRNNTTVGATDTQIARRRPRAAPDASFEILYRFLYLVDLGGNQSSFKDLVDSTSFTDYDSVAGPNQAKLPDHSQFQSGQFTYYVTAKTEATWTQTFTVGDRSFHGFSPDWYYNAPLEPETDYRIWIGIESALGGTFRRGFASVELRTVEEPGPPIPVLVFILLAGLILLFLLILLALWLYRRERERFIAEQAIERISSAYITSSSHITNSAHLSDRPLSQHKPPCLGNCLCHACQCATCVCHPFVYCDPCYGLPNQIPCNVPLRSHCPLQLPLTAVTRSPCEANKVTAIYDDSLYVVKCSNPMTVEDLCTAYRKCQLPILEEFASLPVGYVDPVIHSSLPRNLSCNRSFRCLPYDKNLVQLSDGSSSYINASLIRTVSAFPCVVTQLPLPNSTAAFWRMVWELDGGNLVTLDESGPTPLQLSGQNESETQCYGIVTVRTTSVDATAYYVRRRLRLCSLDSTRSSVLTHWHFLAWNGRGLPVHRIPFLDFIRRVQRERDCNRSVIVQCRLGAGRSGLFLALDLLLTQGQTSGIVDVIKCVNLIRLERVKMVSSIRQYAFIYQCLAEEFDHAQSRIHLSSFFQAVQRLSREDPSSGRTPMEEEFCDLSYDRSMPFSRKRGIEQPSTHSTSLLSDHHQGEGHSLRGKEDRAQDEKPILMDSFRRRDAFILSLRVFCIKDDPLWDVVYDHRLRCVVLMHKFPNMGDLFSRRNSLTSVSCQISPRLTLTREAFKASQDKTFLVHDFTLRLSCPSQNDSINKVRLYEPLFWPENLTDSSTVTLPFLKFLAHIRHWTETQERCCYRPTGDGLRTPLRRPIVVCGNQPGAEGGHRAALFALVWTLLQQTEIDTVIDVFSAVRFMRSRLKEDVIQKSCQYAFIYQSLSDYLRLRSCCCWKRGQMNEEDSVIIGSPIDSTTNCWSDVILNRSTAALIVHPENLQLPSVHQFNRPKIWTTEDRSCSHERLETPADDVSFVASTQVSNDKCLDRESVAKKVKGRRFKNKVRPVADRGVCGGEDFSGESLLRGTDNADESDDLQCRSHLRVKLKAEAEKTAVGVCAGDTPDEPPSKTTSSVDDKAEESIDSKTRILSLRDSNDDDRTISSVVPSKRSETVNKEMDSPCPGQLKRLSIQRKPSLYECNRLVAKCSDKISASCKTGSLWIINEMDDSEVGSNEGSRCDGQKWIYDEGNESLDGDEDHSGVHKPCTRICPTTERHFPFVSNDKVKGYGSTPPADERRKSSALSGTKSRQIEAIRCEDKRRIEVISSASCVKPIKATEWCCSLPDDSDVGSVANVASNVGTTCGLAFARLENSNWIHDPIDASEAGSTDNFANIPATGQGHDHKHLPGSSLNIAIVSSESLNCGGQRDGIKENNIEAENVSNPPDGVDSVMSKVNSSYSKRKQAESEAIINSPDSIDSVVSKVNSSYAKRKQAAVKEEKSYKESEDTDSVDSVVSKVKSSFSKGKQAAVKEQKGYAESEAILSSPDSTDSVLSKVTTSDLREPSRRVEEEKTSVKTGRLFGSLDGTDSAPATPHKNSSETFPTEIVTKIIDASVENATKDIDKREAVESERDASSGTLERSDVDSSLKGDQSLSKQSNSSKYAARGLKEEDESTEELREINDPSMMIKGVNDCFDLTEVDVKKLQLQPQKSSTMTTNTSETVRRLSLDRPFQRDGSVDVVDTLSGSLMSLFPPEYSNRLFTTIAMETSETPLTQLDQQNDGDPLPQRNPSVLLRSKEFHDVYDNIVSAANSSQDNTIYFHAGSVTSASVGHWDTDFSNQNLRAKVHVFPSQLSADVSQPADEVEALSDNSVVEFRQPSGVDDAKPKDSTCHEHNSQNVAVKVKTTKAQNLRQRNDDKSIASSSAGFNSITFLPHSKQETNPSYTERRMSLNRSETVTIKRAAEVPDITCHDAQQQIGSIYSASSSSWGSPKKELPTAKSEDLRDSVSSSWGSIRKPHSNELKKIGPKTSRDSSGSNSVCQPSTNQENDPSDTDQMPLNREEQTEEIKATAAAELPIVVTDVPLIGSIDRVSSSWSSPRKQPPTEFDDLRRGSSSSWGTIGGKPQSKAATQKTSSKNSSRGSARYESFAVGVSQRHTSSNIIRPPTLSDSSEDSVEHLRLGQPSDQKAGPPLDFGTSSNREAKLSEKNGKFPRQENLPMDKTFPLDRYLVNMKSQLSSEIKDGDDGRRSEGFFHSPMRNQENPDEEAGADHVVRPENGENPGTQQRHLSDVLLPTNKRLPLERFLGDSERGGTSRGELSSAATSGTVVTNHLGMASGMMYDAAEDKSRNN